MRPSDVFANIAIARLDVAEAWYTTLIGRAPDARPQYNVMEWHDERQGCLQLLEDRDRAGSGKMTLRVADVAAERKRIVEAGIRAGKVEKAPGASHVRLVDPSGNLVVLEGSA
ncbi:VOC family protein [Pseudoroseicyclus tamaricis]|uniref:VOC family protein n=1 Tax=Pseudoroseicyclus tamaricis TaxID=2705421 RepID=A0A6B2JFQ8_9RHOB|nr:VOC family protein [Pseudoroseicyclus tamaricis]NDU99892.1 VOC family protein [Pseudoroseicyclus tamaricis]